MISNLNKMTGLIVCLAMLSCHQQPKTSHLPADSATIAPLEPQQEEHCVAIYEANAFKKDFFPFEFTNFRSGRLKAFFAGASVDSVENNIDGYITRFYRFSNEVSDISFLVKVDETEPYFYISGATIRNNLFKARNGIFIHMDRKDFFRAIGQPMARCDTFIIQEGDLATYYHFIFRNDKLNAIEIRQTE